MNLPYLKSQLEKNPIVQKQKPKDLFDMHSDFIIDF